MISLDSFYENSSGIVEHFNEFILKHNLHNLVQVDHVCYKCESGEQFESIRRLFESSSEFIYQSIISKRRIAIVKFKKGVETSIGTIMYLELSDQKPDGSQKDGFDHIEIIPLTESIQSFAEKLSSEGENISKVERPHHTTYDLEVGNGFSIKLSAEPLIGKIKREEMKN